MQNLNSINVRLHFKDNGYVKSLIQFTFIVSTIVIAAAIYFLNVLDGLSTITRFSPELLAVAYGAIISAGWLISAMVLLSNGRFRFIQLALGYINESFQKAFISSEGIPFVIVSPKKITDDTVSWNLKGCRLLYVSDKAEPELHKLIQESIGLNDLNDLLFYATEVHFSQIERVSETSKPLSRQLFDKFSSGSVINMKRYVFVRWISYSIIRHTMTLKVVH